MFRATVSNTTRVSRSSKLKAQVSFSDRLLSVVRLYVRPSVRTLFFSRTTGPIPLPLQPSVLGKLYVKRLQDLKLTALLPILHRVTKYHYFKLSIHDFSWLKRYFYSFLIVV